MNQTYFCESIDIYNENILRRHEEMKVREPDILIAKQVITEKVRGLAKQMASIAIATKGMTTKGGIILPGKN